MAVPELTQEERAHLRVLVNEAIERFGSANKLAAAIGIQGSSLGAFLKGGGMAKATARKFAEVTNRTYEEVVGLPAAPGGSLARQRITPVPSSGPPRHRPTASALRKARVFLKQKPLELSDEAIDIAVEDTFLTNPEDADRPGAVAEALRHTIVGTSGQLPLHPLSPPSPSSAPPGGTRRSRLRAR